MANQDWRKPEQFGIVESVKNKMFDLAQDVAQGWYTDLITDLEEQNIISPPEQLFYAYWKFMNHDKEIELQPQSKVGNYYVDFTLNHLTWFINECDPDPPLEILKQISADFPHIAIEIDGHWHEKTPEQVEKDKQRERFLVAQGYTVLRFSAREVFSNVQRCVDEVYELARKPYEDIRRKHRKGHYATHPQPQA